jgi:hypothetical protein
VRQDIWPIVGAALIFGTVLWFWDSPKKSTIQPSQGISKNLSEHSPSLQ